MIELIKKIENNGFTYFSGGNVYFDVSKFEDYGKLALLDKQDLKAGARIAVDENKRNPQDFVLWFTKSKFEKQTMLWDSPWGRGYPGWHVECSAMSMKYLGEQFDIHCGGVDHIPVHHTNEIAQSEAATGKRWVKYWVHGEFLLMDKSKMAKSEGNFLTLKDLVDQGYSSLDYRYFCLLGHYRSQLQFSKDALDAAAFARNNIVDRIKRLKEKAEATSIEELSPKARQYVKQFSDSLAEDLNVPKSLSVLWKVIKDTELQDWEILTVVTEMDSVLGLDFTNIAPDTDIDEETHRLIIEREEARKQKDFKKADQIRDILSERGILVEDTPEGPRWKKVSKK
jgi:cysteinyl-tRNA synthetase